MITESLYHFYSHAREGRDEAQKKGVVKIMNFYSHAREGRDEWGKIKGEIRDVMSTHTPARGVTPIDRP